jgi:pimeloyl-ACP methyl ester carboxylesterase
MTARGNHVLLLHGQPGGAYDWDPVVAALGGRADTIVFDRPGWDGESAPTDLEGNAVAALEALDARGAARATVVGHSLGGAVAAWLAIRHPERVEALVLVAPAANTASLDRLDRVLALRVAGDVGSAALLSGLGVVLATSALRRRVAEGLALDERFLRASARKLLSPGAWRAFVAEQRVLFRDLPVLESRLAEVAAPTTIVAGSEDRVVSLDAARRLETQIPDAHVVVVDGGRHLLPQSHAHEIGGLILAASRVDGGEAMP